MGPLRESARFACPSHEALLEDYLSGSLSQPELEKTASHVAVCAVCQAALSDARASVRLMRLGTMKLDNATQLGPAFPRTVMARIRLHEAVREASSFWQPLVSLAWKFAATAALALLILATYARTGKAPAQTEIASTVESEVHPDLFAPDPATPPANRDEVVLMVADANYAHK